MKNRQPYNLKQTIIAYNIVQVLQNIYMLYVALTSVNMWRIFFSFNCVQLTPPEITAYKSVIRYGFWLYTTNKVLDLCDTIFFVLRKKQSHVTFLHVYHHSSMPLLAFCFGKYSPGHEPTIVALCNTFIHFMMYSYYLMAAAGPKFSKFLWLKKYITKAQIMQFCIIIAYLSVSMFNSCGFNRYVSFGIIMQSIINLVLFVNFYKRAYLSKRKVIRSVNNNYVTESSNKEL